MYKYIYICTDTYMYTCISAYISATALCAFGVDGLSSLLPEFCYPTFCLSLILGPTRNPHRREI